MTSALNKLFYAAMLMAALVYTVEAAKKKRRYLEEENSGPMLGHNYRKNDV